MKPEVFLQGKTVVLKTCTVESWHDFYRNYVKDPMMDMTPYSYDFDRIENAYYSKTTDDTRLYFVIIYEGSIIGQIYLKHMDKHAKTTEFGIALTNDSVKEKGCGTEAIELLIDYVFNTLGFETVFADSVLRNTRSQHVLEKVGFIYTHEDSVFKYYKMIKRKSL